MAKPKIFISHCEDNFEPTEYAIRIIDALGCIPVIAENTPKLSRPVMSLVHDTLENCDAVVVIATPDRDSKNGKEPSQSVSVEIGNIQKMAKFEKKYVIINEESVKFGSMIPETRYKFKMGDFGPIAEALLVELGSMGLFWNYYEIPGSELNFHELMDTLSQLISLGKKGTIKQETFESIVNDFVKDTIKKVTKGVY